MKCDGVNWMVPFAKRDINRGSRYEPKNNQLKVVLIRFAGNHHVYQAPESRCFSSCCSCNWSTRSTVQFLNIFTSEFFRDYWCKSGAVDSGAVNRNTPHRPPVCSMFNEVTQRLKFLMFFPSVTIMTSTL